MLRGVAAVLLAACGRVGFGVGDVASDAQGDAPSDADPDNGTDASPCTFGPWSAPVLVVELSSAADDYDPVFSDDGLEVVFASFRNAGNRDLWRSTRPAIGATWTTPVPIPELSTPSDQEGNPTLSANGLELYYGNSSVYRATRATLQQPFVGMEDVTPDNALFTNALAADITRDGLELYFGAIPVGTAKRQLFRARRASLGAGFQTFEPLPVTDTAFETGYPAISGDGLEIIYSREDSGWDLRSLTRASTTDTFGEDASLDVVNTAQYSEADADLSSDGRELIFNSDRPGLGGNDFYISTRECL